MDQGKRTLEGMPLEIKVEILRHLLRRDYPIKLCPLDSESDQNWGFGSLGILRTSRHLSDVSLGILYGENSFKLHKKFYVVGADSEFANSNLNSDPLRKNLENSRWSILKDMPQDIRSYASSLDCLDLISQTSPGQERLKRVSVEMSYHIIMLFMEGLVPKILKRLRALQSLELIVKIKDWTWASCYSGPTGRSRGDHPFDRDFLLLIKSQLGHVKTIKTKYYNTENALDSADEDNSDEDEPDEGRCEWVLEQLQNRNRAWTPQTPGDNRFVRTTCTMTALDPGVLSNISDIEFGWRKIKKSRRDTDGRNTHISDKTRNVFD